jgi:hypothetical protein
LAALLALGVGVGFLRGSEPAATSQLESDAVHKPAAAPQAPAALAPVRILISTAPEDARLWIDGEQVQNPFTAQRAPSDTVHVIEAQAEGYRQARNSVRFNAETTLRIALQPLEVPREPKPAAPSKPQAPSAAVAPAPKVEPVPAAPPEPAPSPAAPAAPPTDEILGKRQLRRIGI